jgi:hypothetical protein
MVVAGRDSTGVSVGFAATLDGISGLAGACAGGGRPGLGGIDAVGTSSPISGVVSGLIS